MPQETCKKGETTLGTIHAVGSSREFQLRFEPADKLTYPGTAFAWYQLMYREYKQTNETLLEIDVLSSAYQIYQSGRQPFNPETANWVLDAKLGSAVYKKSYGKGEPIAEKNEIDDAPTWSTNYGYWDVQKKLYRASVRDCEPKFNGKAIMHFLDLLVYLGPKYVYTDHGVLTDYDIVHQVLFRVEWEIADNQTSDLRGGSHAGLLVWEDTKYTKFTGAGLKEVVKQWNEVASTFNYSALNLPTKPGKPAAFKSPF